MLHVVLTGLLHLGYHDCLLVGLSLWTVAQDAWAPVWALPLTSCVFLHQLLHLSVL